MKAVSVTIRGEARDYIKLFKPMGVLISECIRMAPKELIKSYQGKTGVPRKSKPASSQRVKISKVTHQTLMSIPKQWRSPFVQAAVEYRPAFSMKEYRKQMRA